jgi:hypothetical protein
MTLTANQAVTWTLAAGSKGSINSSTGLYTAPSSVTAKNNFLGVQALPNDHVINTRIDALPTDAGLTTYLQTQVGSQALHLEISFPQNLYTNLTPTIPMLFNYTSGQNANFPWLGIADIGVEAGFFGSPANDHHVLGVNRQDGTFYEVYAPYKIGDNVGECITCNAQSGYKYHDNYIQPTTGTADASGMPMIPLALRYSEIQNCIDNGVPIKHGFRFTLDNSLNANYFVWPATAIPNPFAGMIPYGTRVRLKSSFNISGYSTAVQCFLTAVKDYGLFMDDGGNRMAVQTMTDAVGTYTLFYALEQEMLGGGGVPATQFEVVDESSLEDMTVTSPGYQTGRVDPANGSVTPDDFVTVIATNGSSESSTMPVILQPVMVGTAQSIGYSFMCGAPAYQLPVWVNGSGTTTFTATMSPSIGTLTSGGLYTPPATCASRQTTIVTITPTADSSQAIYFNVFSYPNTGIYIHLNGSSLAPDGNYGPDANGNIWYTGNGAIWRLAGNTVCYSPFGWPPLTDVGLYQTCWFGDDLRFKYIVPNGTYNVTYNFAFGGAYSTGVITFGMDVNGVIYNGPGTVPGGSAVGGAWDLLGYSPLQIDLCTLLPTCLEFTPVSITIPVTVTDNTLYAALRTANTGVPVMSNLSVIPTSRGGSVIVTVGGNVSRQ